MHWNIDKCLFLFIDDTIKWKKTTLTDCEFVLVCIVVCLCVFVYFVRHYEVVVTSVVQKNSLMQPTTTVVSMCKGPKYYNASTTPIGIPTKTTKNASFYVQTPFKCALITKSILIESRRIKFLEWFIKSFSMFEKRQQFSENLWHISCFPNFPIFFFFRVKSSDWTFDAIFGVS